MSHSGICSNYDFVTNINHIYFYHIILLLGSSNTIYAYHYLEVKVVIGLSVDLFNLIH